MSSKTDRIRSLLQSKFENELFDSSLHSLNDKSNRLRYHNFCYSIRELSRHFLYSLSPEEKVYNCHWFKAQTENGKPTRAQRIKFAIQGGIYDTTLKSLNFDLDEQLEVITKIKKIIDSLSKYTHINPENFKLTNQEIDKNSQQVLDTFVLFIETINIYREQLKSYLDTIIEDDMLGAIVSNFYQNIDRLAPHFSLDEAEVESYHVQEISDYEVVVAVSGTIYVTLEYGSRKDRREGDGLDLNESFPYNTLIRYQIAEDFPNESYEVDSFDADTSSWYDIEH